MRSPFAAAIRLRAYPAAGRVGAQNMGVETDGMRDPDDEVRAYIEGIAPEQRALFERIHRLILEVHPEAAVTLAYRMPTYTAGPRRFHLGVWAHGVSLYGWQGRDGGFAGRHPELLSGKATLRLRDRDAEGIPDDELRELFRELLKP